MATRRSSSQRPLSRHTRRGIERRAATQRRDAIGTGAEVTEDVALEERKCLREGQHRTTRTRIVLRVEHGLIVMVRDRDGRVAERVVVEPVLPEGSALQPVAVPRLIGVPDDRTGVVAIDPLGDVEQRVRRAVEDEVPAPSADFSP